MSAGWLARAEGLLREAGDVPEQGWLALSRAERADAPRDMHRYAEAALEVARRLADADLEAAALIRDGYANVASGSVEAGMAKVDEALAAATGGEVRGLETIGDVICVGIAACELAADWQRIEQWGQAVEGWITSHDHVAVLGFCYACCAEMFIASGEWEMADGMLAEGLQAMQAANLQARCVHPAAKLAELRVTQGRLEEAGRLLAGFEELPESTHALASLYLANGEIAMAAAILHRRLNAIGDDNVLAAPFLSLLVEVQLAQADIAGAAVTAGRLEAVARASSLPRIEALALFARGRVAAAEHDPEAGGILGSAMSAFAAQHLPLDAARARFELARVVEADQPEVAVGEARTALAEFERLGAPREADAAAAFLRERGCRGSDRSEGARPAQPARAGGARAARPGPDERRDRGTPVHQHQDRGQPREQRPVQAQPPEPDRGRRLRGPVPRRGVRPGNRERSPSFPRPVGAGFFRPRRKEEACRRSRREGGGRTRSRASSPSASRRRAGLRPRRCTTCWPTSAATWSGAAGGSLGSPTACCPSMAPTGRRRSGPSSGARVRTRWASSPTRRS